jgi:helicase required for RNAi-mediated heterochromatin assembly 1
MNENLIERWGRSHRRGPHGVAEGWILPAQLNPHVAQYFEDAKRPIDGGSWLRSPEFPSSSEILDLDVGGSNSSSNVEVATNRLKGAWASKGE